MSVVGTVESVWRYPVKGMRGEQPAELFVGYAGVYGDRMYAFTTPSAPAFFPYITGRSRSDMLLFSPRFRDSEAALRPPMVPKVLHTGVGITPLYADEQAMSVLVETPGGDTLAIDDHALSAILGASGAIQLVRSERALTDCRPLTLFSLQTVAALAEETGAAVDKRQFRANIYADFPGLSGFTEDEWIGRRVRIGDRLEVALVERDPRCTMITLHPDTLEESPALLERVVKAHGGCAGVYCAVLTEGLIRPGDPIDLLD